MTSFLTQGAYKALRVISTVLPRHTKRLVLWATLYGKMCGQNELTKDQCERINRVMVLCDDSSALLLPVNLGRFIWNDLDNCMLAAAGAIRGEKPQETAAAEFVRNVPTWLRYASDAFMLKDFQMLMMTHQKSLA